MNKIRMQKEQKHPHTAQQKLQGSDNLHRRPNGQASHPCDSIISDGTDYIFIP